MNEHTEKASQRLTPEYRKAAEMITQVLSQNVLKRKLETKVPKEILKDGAIVCVIRDFKSRDIPSDIHWRWNQVKARKIINIQNIAGQFEIEFFKLMARPIQKIPYKLWRFNIMKVENNGSRSTQLRVLWCEHGEKDILSAGVLNELQFLSPFMDPITAKEIWPLKL